MPLQRFDGVADGSGDQVVLFGDNDRLYENMRVVIAEQFQQQRRLDTPKPIHRPQGTHSLSAPKVLLRQWCRDCCGPSRIVPESALSRNGLAAESCAHRCCGLCVTAVGGRSQLWCFAPVPLCHLDGRPLTGGVKP